MTALDPDTFGALRTSLAGYFARRVRDAHAVEDLVQETFLRVHDKHAELRDEERVAAWIWRIARNVLADHGRARRKQEADLLEDLPEREPEGEGLEAEIARWLPRMLESLPPELAEAVRLAELEGLPQERIAERLGLSLSGAKSRVQRGRAALRRKLLECCHFELDRHGQVVDLRRRGPCDAC